VIKKTEGEIVKLEQTIKGIYSGLFSSLVIFLHFTSVYFISISKQDRRRHRELDEKIKDAKAARGRTDSPKSQGDITVDFLQRIFYFSIFISFSPKKYTYP